MSVVKDIRENTTSLLENATDAGAKVYNAKVTPNLVKNLPCIIVFTPQVSGTTQSLNPPAFIENVTIEIDVLVALTENWQDQVDDIIEDIKDTLFNSATWAGYFTSIESYTINYAEEGNAEIPIATGIFTINTLVWKAHDLT